MLPERLQYLVQKYQPNEGQTAKIFLLQLLASNGTRLAYGTLKGEQTKSLLFVENLLVVSKSVEVIRSMEARNAPEQSVRNFKKDFGLEKSNNLSL